jgi:hypothetical protein
MLETCSGSWVKTVTRTVCQYFGEWLKGQPKLTTINVVGDGNVIVINHLSKDPRDR